jgi:hypothetical protein
MCMIKYATVCSLGLWGFEGFLTPPLGAADLDAEPPADSTGVAADDAVEGAPGNWWLACGTIVVLALRRRAAGPACAPSDSLRASGSRARTCVIW